MLRGECKMSNKNYQIYVGGIVEIAKALGHGVEIIEG